MYHIGDRVFVRSDLKALSYYNEVIVVRAMEKMAGMETKILSSTYDKALKVWTYRIENGRGYTWTDDMLLPFGDELPMDDSDFDLAEFI